MAVVRELITVLGTAVDQTGFHQYETGIARIKGLALGLGKMLGIGFGVDKIIEFADELVKSGKEIGKMRLELNLIARPIDDMDAAQQKVFETAQQLRVAYKDVFQTFKQFSIEMRETNIPQDKILQTTKNIYEALRVERSSPEKMQEVMSVFERTFKRGAMRSVGVGQLFGLSPEIFKMLEKAFNTNEEGLRALAKAGKITAEAITEAFGVTNKELDEKFAKVPLKIGDAFVIINNDLIELVRQVYKLTEMSEFFGRIIVFVWRGFRNAIVSVTEAMGGLKNVVQVLGIALAIALGPWLLSTLASVVTLTLSWAAANAVLLVGWVAIGVAIAAVALGIQDLIFWMQGKRSVIGTWVGPFADLAENFKKLDIFSGFRLFDDAMKGNWDAFVADWRIFVKDAPAEIALISTAVLGIGIAFGVIVPVIRGILRTLRAITAESAAAKAAVVTEAAGGAAAGAGGAAAVGAGGAAVGAAAQANTFTGLMWLGQKITALIGVAAGGRAIYDAAKDPEAWYKKWGDYLVTGKSPWADQKKREPFNLGIMDYLNRPSRFETKPGDVNIWDLAKTLGERMWYGPEAIRNQNAVPSVTPGAFNPNAGPRVQHTEINPSLVQNNNIRVETLLDSAQIGQAIQSQLTNYGEQLINGVSRQLNVAGPRAEQPTQ